MRLRETLQVREHENNPVEKAAAPFLDCSCCFSAHGLLCGKDPDQHAQKSQKKMDKPGATTGISQYICTEEGARWVSGGERALATVIWSM